MSDENVSKNDMITAMCMIKNEKNSAKIDDYIEKITNMNQEDFEKAIKSKGLSNLRDIEKYITELFSERNITEIPKIDINELIYCNIVNDSAIIHVIQDDMSQRMSSEGLKESELELIDALEKIKAIMQNDVNIKQIHGISGLLRGRILKMFERLQFDTRELKIEDAKDDAEMCKFYERFKDKKIIGRASISRDVIFSSEWEKIKDDRKKELLNSNLER